MRTLEEILHPKAITLSLVADMVSLSEADIRSVLAGAEQAGDVQRV